MHQSDIDLIILEKSVQGVIEPHKTPDSCLVM
jgi:hypothetical protein